MNWKTIFVAVFASIRVMCNAQGLSLEEAMNKANSTQLSEAEWQQRIAALKLESAKANRLPMIYGDANLQRNLIIPVTPVPAIAFNPNAEQGEMMPLRFATDWTAKAGLQGSFDLFNPQNHTAIEEAKLNEAKAAVEIENQKASLKRTITDLYAQCLLSMEQSKIAEATWNNYREIEQIIKARYEEGRASEIEYNKTLQKLNELEQLLREANAIVRINVNNLSEFIHLDGVPELTTSLEEIMQTATGDDDFERKQLQLDWQNTQYKWKKINLEALPKLTLNAYYGSNHYSNSFDLLNSQYWYGNSFVNLSIRIPITETYNRSITRNQLQHQLKLTQLKLDDLQKKDAIKKLNKAENLSMYQSRVASAQKNLQLADSNLKLVEEQVKSGRVLITELNKEMDNYFTAQKNVWQAQYDYIKKLIE